MSLRRHRLRRDQKTPARPPVTVTLQWKGGLRFAGPTPGGELVLDGDSAAGPSPVQALAFTLSRRSPNYTGRLSPDEYRQIFASASGRYGSTRDYARHTFDSLIARGIHDRELEMLLGLSKD